MTIAPLLPSHVSDALQVGQLLRQTALLEQRVAEVACCVLAQVLHNAVHAPAASYRQLLRKTLSSLVPVLAQHCPGVAQDTVATTAQSKGEEDEEDEDEEVTLNAHSSFPSSSPLSPALDQQDDWSDWDEESEADEDFVKTQVVNLLKFVSTLSPLTKASAPPLPPGAAASAPSIVGDVLSEMLQRLVAHGVAGHQHASIVGWIKTQMISS